MADGTVRVNFEADVSDVRKGTRDTIKELDKVNKAAAKSSADATAGASKALAGISRLIATGKVSAKSLEKVGKQASNSVGAIAGVASGVAAVFGIGIPAAAAIAEAAIGSIRSGLKSVTAETREAAAAQRDYTVAQLAAAGSADAVAVTTTAAAEATRKLDEARKSGTASAQEIVDLEHAERAAAADAIAAQNTHADAVQKAGESQAKYAEQMAQVIDKSKQLAPQLAAANGGFLNQHVYALAAAKALNDHAASAKGLTADQRAAERAVADYIEKTDDIPADIKTLITTPGMNPALDHFNSLQAKANALDGRQITITTHLDTITETHRQGLATGGRIGGSFDGKDDVPINVSKGEVILNPRQQRAVDGGATINQALAGAPTVYAGGGFAGGGKSKAKHGLDYRKAQVAVEAARKRLRDAEKKYGKGSLQARQAQVALDAAEAKLRKAGGKERGAAGERRNDRNQKILDTAEERFGATMSADDLALAKAERTSGFGDDAAVLGSEKKHINARILEIRRLRKRKGLSREQRADLNDKEASLIRQLLGIDESLTSGAGGSGGGAAGGGDAGADPFELARATEAGVASGLGRAYAYVAGGSGDIGYGTGGSAVESAGSVHFENVTFTNSVQNQSAFAKAANVGNDVMNGGKVRSSRQTVAFSG